ncbi:hypothetical protein D3C78_1547050 [compost metagenome]
MFPPVAASSISFFHAVESAVYVPSLAKVSSMLPFTATGAAVGLGDTVGTGETTGGAVSSGVGVGVTSSLPV